MESSPSCFLTRSSEAQDSSPYVGRVGPARRVGCVTSMPRSLSQRQIRSKPRSTMDSSTERPITRGRSEEHTSELQSRLHLVCRLLLEKKNVHSQLRWLHSPGHSALPAISPAHSE